MDRKRKRVLDQPIYCEKIMDRKRKKVLDLPIYCENHSQLAAVSLSEIRRQQYSIEKG